MAAASPELKVQFGSRRWPCVLDPELALSRHGPVLARQLGDVVQLWIVREFWHILDSSEFYTEHPEALMADQQMPQRRRWAIREWEHIRSENDLAGLKLYWIGDGLSESLLPEGINADVLGAYESLAWSLDRRIMSPTPMNSAMRDAAALAAALGNILVLSRMPRDAEEPALPPICGALQSWDIRCRQVETQDPIAGIERDYLRDLLVQAGLCNLIWGGLQFAAVRLLLPNAPLAFPAPAESDDDYLAEAVTVPAADPWEAAQAFWHPI